MPNSNLKNISVTILTKNSQLYLKEVLGALSPFGEILLYDTGSKDNTMDIARQFSNVQIVEAPFEGFGPSHNKASSAATHDWILSIDSDEIVSPAFLQSIISQELLSDTVYSFSRHNYFNGKFIRHCGWHPDRQIKLYNRTKTRFTDAHVHETIISTGMKCQLLNGAIMHYSYGHLSDFLSKMQSYSTLFAEQYQGKRDSSLTKALSHGFYAFFKSYFLQRGFLDGYEGFVISTYNAHTAYYKYLKLYEANQKIKAKLTRKEVG